MAGSSLLMLIDDIATILDDVSVMAKVATKKTVGVLGDDLALNAEQVSGVRADRELPVVWEVAKGSMINKAILVPAALAISAFSPPLIFPLLMVGGAFLCYEGVEKLAHAILDPPKEKEEAHRALVERVSDPNVDLVAVERTRIRGAIRTDFILSAEIIVIALGTFAGATFSKQAITLSLIGVGFTIGVYGLVAGIVKLDDVGLHLQKRGGMGAPLGRGLLLAAPWLMKTLSVLGTAAMFLVGGGIVAHGWHRLEATIEQAAHWLGQQGLVGSALALITPTLLNGLIGLLLGGLVYGVSLLVKRVLQRKA